MTSIAVGSKVNTSRRKAIVVINILQRGWVEGRTLSGKVISFSVSDVTKVW